MKAKTYFFLSILFILLFSACNDDDNNRREPDNTNTANEWIYQQMKDLYLWDVPSNPNYNQNPEAFFESLLYKRDQMDGDRFSVIEEKDNNKAKSAYNTGKLGFDFVMKNYFKNDKQENSNLGFFVVNVRENSGARAKGLKRGNIIYAIDGVVINYSNYKDMHYHLETTNSASLSLYDENGNEKEISNIQANLDYDPENPIWMSKVIDPEGAKIGYIVYNEFERGDNYKYDIELTQKIQELTIQSGVRDIVLDLRYNPGGYVISATHLASALVPNRSTNDIFVKYTYNPTNHDLLVKKHGNIKKFVDKIYGTGQAIPKTNLNRLYILTSESTASASEALISGLKPYMGDNLKQVGMTTMGKDKGSWAVEDSRYNWTLHPLIMRILNKNDNAEYGGNYEHGISPSLDFKVDEWEEGYELMQAKDINGDIQYCPLIYPWRSGLKELGDEEESLLARAIADIKGESRKAVTKSYTTKTTSAKVPTIKNPRKPRMIVEPKISE